MTKVVIEEKDEGTKVVTMTTDEERVRKALDLALSLPAGEFIAFMSHLNAFTRSLREERW
jgi:hypothetical protein